MKDLRIFLRRLFLTIVMPIAVFLVIYEYLYRSIPESHNSYKLKDAYLSQHASDVEILILGASNALFGVDPAVLSRPAFNAANVSQDLKYDYDIFNKYFPALTHLKYVILPVSYWSLFASLRTGPEDWRIRKYQIYMGLREYPWYHIRYNFEASRLGDRDCIAYYLKHNSFYECDTLGKGTVYTLAKRRKDWENTGKIDALRHTVIGKTDSLVWKEQSAQNMFYLNAIISKCCQKHVRVILMNIPTWHTYYEHLNQEQLTRMYASVGEILKNRPDVKWIDLLRDKRFVEDDFYDATHLNENGARKVSEILNSYFN